MKLKKPIYLDYAATTPMDPRVAKLMQNYLTLDGCFGNPASNTHDYGLSARAAVERAREQVAALIHADPKEIIWTSGATESDNLAIIGALRFYKDKGSHIITAKTEHKAVLDTCKYLETTGVRVTYLTPKKNGLIDVKEFEQAIQTDTVLASIMQVNNEIGVVQDIEGIGKICRHHQIIFHVDAAQGVGKIPINLQTLPVDLMSFSAHKVYGPKGMGALYVRRKPRIRLQPLIYGGGHEQGLRSGTLALHQIVGMGEAFAIANDELTNEVKRLKQLREKLWQQLNLLPDIYLNGDFNQSVPGILNISFAGIDGMALLWAIKDLAVSTGSACTSADITPSYVLAALGVPNHLAHSTLRISFGRFTTEAEIDFAAQEIVKQVEWLRGIAPCSNYPTK